MLLGPGDVRTLTVDTLDEYFQQGYVTEQTFLWKAGMKEWQKLELVLAEHPEPETPFHVLMDDGSVRVLTVEQIDDFYRLELIGEDTLLWQDGMSGWVPLAWLADGDDDGELVTNPVATRVPQRQPQALATSAVPSRLEHAVVTTSRPNPTPLKVVSGGHAAQPHVSTSTHARQLPADSPPVSARVQEPLLPSTPPVALSLTPAPVETSKASGAERWFVRFAIAAGLVMVFGRNDAFYLVASAANQSRAYLDTEQRTFGGPLFGTPRAVQDLLKSTGGPLEPVRVPVVAAQLLTTPTAKAATLSEAKPTTPIAATTADTKKPDTAATMPTPKTSQTGSSPALSGNVAAALLGQPKPKAPTPSRAAAPARRPAKKSKGLGATGSGSYYDPLNGAL
ncbi:MAG: GYF domain-containing protein [Polyangiaceae bacterium]